MQAVPRPWLALGRQRYRYALFGALFGFLFPCVATAVTLLAHGTFGLAAVVAAHRTDPLLMIIDTAPLWLGIFASLAGSRQDDLNQTLGALEQTNLRLETANAMLE